MTSLGHLENGILRKDQESFLGNLDGEKYLAGICLFLMRLLMKPHDVLTSATPRGSPKSRF